MGRPSAFMSEVGSTGGSRSVGRRYIAGSGQVDTATRPFSPDAQRRSAAQTRSTEPKPILSAVGAFRRSRTRSP